MVWKKGDRDSPATLESQQRMPLIRNPVGDVDSKFPHQAFHDI